MNATKPRPRYPRTLHFPWTQHSTTDDKIWSLEQVREQFDGREYVASAKLDGECTTMTREYIHARSPDGRDHVSRHAVKSLWGSIRCDIPDHYRICGENVYAEHSIHYHELTAYFYVFTIFNEKGVGLPWDETVGYATMLGLKTVPVLARGVWDESEVKSLMMGSPVFGGRDIETKLPALEGYVARLTGEIQIGKVEDADENSREILMGVGKCVRKGHVKTADHWLDKPMVVNDLADGVEL